MGITEKIPWKYNRQWCELLGKSGTSMFVSIKPGVVTENERTFIAECIKENSKKRSVAELLDWQNTCLPQRWKFDEETKVFHRYEPEGLSVPWGSGEIWETVWKKLNSLNGKS